MAVTLEARQTNDETIQHMCTSHNQCFTVSECKFCKIPGVGYIVMLCIQMTALRNILGAVGNGIDGTSVRICWFMVIQIIMSVYVLCDLQGEHRGSLV